MQRRGRDYELIGNGVFLMATYNGAGEREMVRAALQPWEEQWQEMQQESPGATPAIQQERPFVRLLVGGLGFGLGLQEALRSPLVARVDLLELEEAVIRWNRGVLREVNGNALDDPRVSVMREDMVLFLQKTSIIPGIKNTDLPGIYHGIILDTDNGPGWLSRPANRFLYSAQGTALLKKILLPGGVLSTWSASPVPPYYALLQRYFPVVLEKTVLEKTGQTSNYYLACKTRSTLTAAEIRG